MERHDRQYLQLSQIQQGTLCHSWCCEGVSTWLGSRIGFDCPSIRILHTRLSLPWIFETGAYPLPYVAISKHIIHDYMLYSNRIVWKLYPTSATAAPNNSGLWLTQAPTNKPPFEPPWMVSLEGLVIFSRKRYSAAEIKSSKLFCLLRSRPESHHFVPYSLLCNEKMLLLIE